VDRLEFLEVMLGDQPALDPEETFYQRALAGDLDALAEQSERFMKEGSAEAYLDTVALPALRLAQADALRGALAEERMGQLRESVLTLLEDLDGAQEEEHATADDGPGEERRAVPLAWQAPGSVLCLAGRGPLDALVAAMLAELLAWRGFGVQQGSAGLVNLPAVPPRLACLCLLEGGSSAAAARYLLRRTRRRLPGVATVALVWQGEATAEDRLAAALRAEGGAEPAPMATSLAEALDLVAESTGAEAVAERIAPPGQSTADPAPGGTGTAAATA
jgi:hypothetical protein